MNILVVSATHFEVKPLLDFLEITEPVVGMNVMRKKTEAYDAKVLITGVGMVNTAFMLGRYTHEHFDLVINVGVCGAFDKQLQLGGLVRITEDVLSEMGAEDGDEFLTYNQLNLPGKHTFSEKYTVFIPMINTLKKVTGITVNKVHGNEISIEKIKQLYNPDVESMEGAAFFAAAENSGKNMTQILFEDELKSISVPSSNNYIQIRAISNYVEKRDKSKWQMGLAISNLNKFVIDLLNTF